MDYLKIALLIIIPYIIYSLILALLRKKYDLEMSKMGRMMIFIMIDLVILMIFR
jgi:hypothetical protein